jgi:uncharacterized membrane protein
MMNAMGGGGSATTVLLVVLWLLSAALMFGAGYVVARLRSGTPRDEPLALLRRRLANGEIDADQYLQLVSTIESR